MADKITLCDSTFFSIGNSSSQPYFQMGPSISWTPGFYNLYIQATVGSLVQYINVLATVNVTPCKTATVTTPIVQNMTIHQLYPSANPTSIANVSKGFSLS